MSAVAPYCRFSKTNAFDDLNHPFMNRFENGRIIRVPHDDKSGRRITIFPWEYRGARPVYKKPTNLAGHYDTGFGYNFFHDTFPIINNLINKRFHFLTLRPLTILSRKNHPGRDGIPALLQIRVYLYSSVVKKLPALTPVSVSIPPASSGREASGWAGRLDAPCRCRFF